MCVKKGKIEESPIVLGMEFLSVIPRDIHTNHFALTFYRQTIVET